MSNIIGNGSIIYNKQITRKLIDGQGNEYFNTEMTGGLTIRQELAARAMQGLLSSLSGSTNLIYEGIGQTSLNNLAADAVCMADALLTQLNKS